MYYLRTKPAASAIQFTVDKSKVKKSVATSTNGTNGTNGTVANGSSEANDESYNMQAMVCSLQNKDECLMCGS